MSKKTIYVAVCAGAIIVAALALVLRTFSPAPKPCAGPLPLAATPPKEMAVYSLVAGVNHRVAAFDYRGAPYSSGATSPWPELS